MQIRRKTPWEKEWERMIAQEERFLKKETAGAIRAVNRNLEKYVPKKLRATLDAAFGKAFEVIFTRGTPVIERTYDKEKRSVDYKVRAYEAELRGSRKSLSAFRRQSGAVRAVNLAVSAVEGVGLGALGIGLPDIVLFTGVLLKNIYETAMNYGFGYETEQERIFLLKVIEAAVSDGEAQRRINEELNTWCGKEHAALCGGMEQPPLAADRAEQARRTAAALSEKLLYMKFLQGIPIVGAVGGLSDVWCLKEVSAYANLKYQRRFLLQNR